VGPCCFWFLCRWKVKTMMNDDAFVFLEDEGARECWSLG